MAMIRLLLCGVVGLLVLSGCEREGPGERAGERVDEAADEMRDSIDELTERP